MKKKFLAAILAAAVMVTSIQLPPMEVRAEGTDDLSEYDTVFKNEGLYKTADSAVAELWETFETAYKAAKAAGNEVTDEQISALSAAKTALDTTDNKRTILYRAVGVDGNTYTTPSQEEQQATDIYKVGDEFHFPELGETKILELEYLELYNTGSGWNLQVVQDSASNNGFKVSGLDQGDDRMYLYYTAPRTGVYSVEYKYYSGSGSNSFTLAGNNIDFGNGNFSGNGQSDSNGANLYTGNFEFEVTTSGAGMIEVVPGSAKAPTLDVMTITTKEVDLNVEITEDSRGVISGDTVVRQNASEEYTITPNEGYQVEWVEVNGEEVELSKSTPANGTTGASYTFTVTGGNEDITIVPEYDYFNYSEDNRFEFPTEKEQPVTLEMEYLVLNNIEDGDEDPHDSSVTYPLSVGEDNDWNSQTAKFLNSLNNNDEALLYYHAPKMGTYKAVVTYRSGNLQNGLTWSETTDSKIQTGTITAGASDHPAVHTYEFEFIVDKAGDGVLKFAGSGANAPQMDKIEITPKAFTYNVTKVPCENGSIEGEATTITEGNEVTYTITPDAGYVVKNVTVDGASYVENNTNGVYTVTISNPTKDVTIDVEFEKEAYVAGYNAVLEDNILMKFHMKLSQAVIDQEPKVVIGLDGSEPKEFPLSDGEVVEGNYVFEYGVPAKDMRTNINVQVVSADGDKTFFTGVYTVAGYTADLKEEESENTKIENLVDAMLEFGDYANKYFDKKSTEESPALTQEDYAFLQTMERQVSGQSGSYVGSSLLLRSETVVRHYFNSPVNSENLPAGYTSGNKKGTNGTTFYYIESGIPAHELGKYSPITITTDNGEMSITFNPLSYAYSVINKESTDEEMIRLEKVVSAMYLYYKAAQEYLAPETNE